MLSAYRLYPALALALLAAGSIWLERLTRAPEMDAGPSPRSVPDFIASDARITGYGKDGTIRYVLLADQLTHHPQRDVTDLDRPRLEILSENARRMTITSRSGEVSSQGEQVDFRGEVVAVRDAVPGQDSLHFASEQLTVWPDDSRAASSSPVKLRQGLTTADALGLRANNLFGTLDLIGQVHTIIPRRQGKTK
ncbi:LPS export ABC transporter periplasmic protein LptC [Azoarcus sp. L1K30]|uniref:LPS export ABC transporter periplasmic protein LptC n=1 Tax=Azoarcus sp. L1K30 TaxID=2820277 RepID=UPI001B843A12|nr:LPS export ABC transporter periplasmic protein LptC [Azoarcus sp. L1K30]MBR0568299.1 LPS export ABC transporter periplasmic protein LptC [Azoarcus sp. L1K30]